MRKHSPLAISRFRLRTRTELEPNLFMCGTAPCVIVNTHQKCVPYWYRLSIGRVA
jgi:hypothetical protein